MNTMRALRHACSTFVLPTLVVLAAFTTAVADDWRSVGPGGGGHQQFPAISPYDPSLLFVACDMSGFYRSEDAGATWRMHEQIRMTTHEAVFHPRDPNVVYVSTRYPIYEGMRLTGGWRLWRSKDRGATWKVLYEHVYDIFSTNGPTACLIDPANPDRMWLALKQPYPAPLMVSDDGGNSWTSAGEGLPRAGADRLFLSPGESPSLTLYARAGEGAYRSEDAGATWQPISAELGPVIDLCVLPPNQPDDSPTLYVTGRAKGQGVQTRGAVLRSTDDGQSWKDLSESFVAAAFDDGRVVRMRRIAGNPTRPATLYIAADLQSPRGRQRRGVYKTTDGGETWSFVFPREEVTDEIARKRSRANPQGFETGWIPMELNWGWGGTAMFLAVSQSDPDHLLRTDMGRTIGTRDGGKTWQALYSNRGEIGRYSSRGLEVTATYRVVFDPHNDQRLWITYTDIGNWRSDDGGATWQYAMRGAQFRNTMYELRTDLDLPDRLYGVCSNTHDIPVWKYICRDPKTFTGGFCVSDDGGLTWAMRGEGLPNAACTALVVDPRGDPRNRTLYLIAFGRGVYKSTDSGRSWQRKVRGMESFLDMNEHLYTLDIGPDGTLYAGVTKRVRFVPGKRADSRGGALFISEDGAESWRRVGPQMPNQPSGAKNEFSYLYDVVASPHDANEVLAACAIDVHSRTAAPGGLYRSRDKGKTWDRILANPQCRRADYHPSDPSVLFCGTGDDGLHISRDGGESWRPAKGLPFKHVFRTTVDPRDSNRVWVTTRGGGVWTAKLDE